MKTAYEILDQLMGYVEPRRGHGFTIRKRHSTGPMDPNWDVDGGILSRERLQRFSEKLDALKKSDPIISFDTEG